MEVIDKKSIVFVLAPQYQVALQYVWRLEKMGFVAFIVEKKEDMDIVSNSDIHKQNIYSEKMYAIGIGRCIEEVVAWSEKEKRLKAIALVSGGYEQKKIAIQQAPTIVIHGAAEEQEYLMAQQTFHAMKTTEKVVIWEDSILPTCYYNDAEVLEKTVKKVSYWFNLH